jgi:hypothetical protein
MNNHSLLGHTSSSTSTSRAEVCFPCLIERHPGGIQNADHDIAIYGLYLDNPQSAASMNWYGNKKVPDLALLPHLRALSDVLWSYWVRENPDIKNIRYFFMLGISNDQTNQLIASSLQHAKKQLSPWPGISFSADTDEGHALLGMYPRTQTACLPNVKILRN